MIRVAIVDDDRADRKKIRDCLDFVARKENQIFEVSEFCNAESFFMKFDCNYEIVFFDIDMPCCDGMTAAKRLRRIDKVVTLVFITNLAQYAVAGYEVDALDYILKPVDKYSFSLKMKRVLSRTVKNAEDSIMVPTDDKDMIPLKISTIRYVEVRGHYVVFHTADGKYSQYSTLKSVEDKLSGFSFAKCNRCFLVNLAYIDKIRDGEAIVGGEGLQISRPQRKAFLAAFSDYLGGRKNV